MMEVPSRILKYCDKHEESKSEIEILHKRTEFKSGKMSKEELETVSEAENILYERMRINLEKIREWDLEVRGHTKSDLNWNIADVKITGDVPEDAIPVIENGNFGYRCRSIVGNLVIATYYHKIEGSKKFMAIEYKNGET